MQGIYLYIIMNNFKFFSFSLTLLVSNIYYSQLISDKWYQLYNSEGISVEINFSITEDGCNNGYPTIFKYRYNGKLLPYDKYIDWKLDYTNCNDQIYTYSSGAKIGGYNIQNELGKGLLEDLIKEEFDDAITSKKIISNLYDVSTGYTKSFSNKIKKLKLLNGFHAKNYPDGSLYEGYFKNDKFNGFGKYEGISDGDKIKTVGDWENGKFIKGAVYINDKYAGEYIDGIFKPVASKNIKSNNKSSYNKDVNFYNNDYVISYTLDKLSTYNLKFSANYADGYLGWYAGIKFKPNTQYPTSSGIYVVNNGIIEMWDGDYMDLGYFGPLKQTKNGNCFFNGGITKMLFYPLWWSGGIGIGWERTIENRDHYFDSGTYWGNEWMVNKDLGGLRAYFETDLQLKIANRIVLKYGLLFNGSLNSQIGFGYAFI